MHIYAYGSVCRGEVKPGSDIDALALVQDTATWLDPYVFSVYPYARLQELWTEGNPFAWHLSLEARLLFAEDGIDYLRELGPPDPYANWPADSEKFIRLYREAAHALAARGDTAVFELGTMFLAIRNLAICHSLTDGRSPVFARRAFERLGADSLNLDSRTSQILEDARILSTRGYGRPPAEEDIRRVLSAQAGIERWMRSLIAN